MILERGNNPWRLAVLYLGLGVSLLWSGWWGLSILHWYRLSAVFHASAARAARDGRLQIVENASEIAHGADVRLWAAIIYCAALPVMLAGCLLIFRHLKLCNIKLKRS